ncbi:MAG: Trk system potassium transporter TrkA, partial [Peptostreptococcus sp.]|nr:Trk system potassium transporter TrkA [Peptostreptococcus sp.]
INGNAINREILKEAGVEEADLLIGCTSSDEINMFSCLFAKNLGAKNTIARVRNPEYYSQLNYIKEDLGLSMIINPEFVAANVISRILRFPSAIKVETFAKGKVELMEFKIYENSELVGKQMKDVVKTFGVKILVCAIQRWDEVFIPDGNFTFEKRDKLSIAGSHEDLEKFLKKVGGLKRKVKTVMIIGGGKIAYYLCKSLENINIKTKIIERDRKTCHFLAQNLPKVDIIHGDGTDNQILEEEGIHEVDAFVSLTGIDEENIIMSMYADSKGASKVITKISQSTFKDMIDTFNLDTVISPKELTATRILQYVKAMNNSYGSQLNSLYRIVNDKVEVLEFSVNATGRIVNQPLKDLRFKKGMLIACIVRNGKIIIPGGDDKIMVGDNIIIVTSSLRITDIEDILERSV